jgi:uncharacterized protein
VKLIGFAIVSLVVVGMSGCAKEMTAAPLGPCGVCARRLACDEPTKTCRRTAESSVRTRDGIILHTTVFLPPEVPEAGVASLLERTPYGFPDWRTRFEEKARFHNSRGYAFVLQDCRGRFGSSGAYEAPFVTEMADGQDATEWIVQQPWANGMLGTIGVSESAYTAVAAAVGNPLVKVVVADDGPKDNGFELDGGLIHLGYLEWWHFLEHDGNYPSVAVTASATNSLDVVGLDGLVLGRLDPFWRTMATAETPDASVYDGESLKNRYADVCMPALLVYSAQSPWTDPIDIWRGLLGQGCARQRMNQRLVVTPEAHGYHSTALFSGVTTPVTALMLDYIDKFLDSRSLDLAEVPRVQFSALGETAYHGASDWPPTGITPRTLYLRNAGTIADAALSETAPGVETPDSLTIDPATMDPCSPSYPFVAYVSAPLTAPIVVAGIPHIELFMSTTTPDADVIADLYEYRPGSMPAYQRVGSTAGVRLRYRDGFSSPAPMNPGEATHIAFDLFSVSYRFGQGSSIVLSLSGGECEFAENPQSGQPVASQSERRPSMHRYFHDAHHLSRLLLPTVN